jgi:hypothetical protein
MKLGEYLIAHGWRECDEKDPRTDWEKDGKRRKAYDALLIEWCKLSPALEAAERAKADGKPSPF